MKKPRVFGGEDSECMLEKSLKKASNGSHRTGRWTIEEKLLFLYGLHKFGKGRWKKIGTLLPTRCVCGISMVPYFASYQTFWASGFGGGFAGKLSLVYVCFYR